MSVKASISLTESQEAYARDLVAQGHYASLSAVLQHGLELMREQSQNTDALRELLKQRRNKMVTDYSHPLWQNEWLSRLATILLTSKALAQEDASSNATSKLSSQA